MKTKRKHGKFLMVAVLIFTATFIFAACRFVGSAVFNSASTVKGKADTDWNLVLVNKYNEVSEDLPKLTVLFNGEKIDSRVYPYLQEMFNAARANGVYPIVVSGYRTADEQKHEMDLKIEAFINDGYSKSKAESEAKKWVADVDNSEHRTGLAADINGDAEHSSNDEVYEWLKSNAHKFGFILRYPENKEKITKTAYEPWHFRYVGKKAAAKIYKDDLCLEEYIKESA